MLLHFTKPPQALSAAGMPKPKSNTKNPTLAQAHLLLEAHVLRLHLLEPLLQLSQLTREHHVLQVAQLPSGRASAAITSSAARACSLLLLDVHGRGGCWIVTGWGWGVGSRAAGSDRAISADVYSSE
jgi:hypothetical protein